MTASDRQTGPAVDVLVTVGTDHHPFDRLVRWIDEWLAPGGGRSVLVQTGSSALPRTAASVPTLPFQELEDSMRRARAVVCHGGAGTIMLAASVDKRPIVVPRRAALGEAVDEHQVAFARRLAIDGTIALAETREELHGLLEEALRDPSRASRHSIDRDDVGAARRFEELVAELFPAARSGRPSRGGAAA